MNLSYRKLVAADATKYRAIRLECLKAFPDNFGSTFEEQSKLPKLMFEAALAQPPDERFVMGAFDQHKLIGICGFVPVRSGYKHIPKHTGLCIQVYVKSAYSGKRIGLGLMQNMLAEAFELTDIDQIILEVKEGNASAIRVYEQAGFQPYIPDQTNASVIDDGSRHMIIYRDKQY